MTNKVKASLDPGVESELNGNNRMFATEGNVGYQRVGEALTATDWRMIESERLTVSPSSRLRRLTPVRHKVSASQKWGVGGRLRTVASNSVTNSLNRSSRRSDRGISSRTPFELSNLTFRATRAHYVWLENLGVGDLVSGEESLRQTTIHLAEAL